MESSSQEIHENLNAVIDYQTHHRLRETQGRHRAEDLNERIMIWSVFVTLAIFGVGFGQVFVLKSFFAEKKPSAMYGRHWESSAHQDPGHNIRNIAVIKSCDYGLLCLLGDIILFWLFYDYLYTLFVRTVQSHPQEELCCLSFKFVILSF